LGRDPSGCAGGGHGDVLESGRQSGLKNQSLRA